jgi:hypothetical protein
MTEKHYLYVLGFDAAPRPVIFYVGHTNNPKRRETEHKAAAKDITNTEYKYQWCRELEAVGVEWDFIVLDEIEDDEDSEYEWVLKFARENKKNGITFINDLPLTNMKAGDFLTEILDRTDIRTRHDIKKYRQERKELEELRKINYMREQSDNYVGTETAELLGKYIDQLGLAAAEKNTEARQALDKRAQEYVKMINDPKRQARIRAETEELMRKELGL